MRSSVLPIFCFPCVNTQIIQPQTIIVCFVFFLIICRSEFGTTNTDFSKFLVFCWEMLWPCLWLSVLITVVFCFVTISVAYNKFSVFKKDFFCFVFLFVNLCCAFKNGKNFWLLDLRHLKMKTMKIWSIAVQTYRLQLQINFLLRRLKSWRPHSSPSKGKPSSFLHTSFSWLLCFAFNAT